MSDVNKLKKKTTTESILMYCYFNILNFVFGLNYLLEFYVDNFIRYIFGYYWSRTNGFVDNFEG